MIRRPPRSTRTDTLCPYTTLFRSAYGLQSGGRATAPPAQLPMSARRRLDPRRSAGRGHCRGCPADGRSAAPDLAAGSARLDAGGGDLHSAHAVHPVQMDIAAGPSEILLAALPPSASSHPCSPISTRRWANLRLFASLPP